MLVNSAGLAKNRYLKVYKHTHTHTYKWFQAEL